MAIETDGSAPYASSKSLIGLIEGYRNKGYATPFNHAVLAKAGVEDSLIARTMQSLKLLDLINDDGTPTEQFEALKLARGDDEFKKRLASWLTSVYAPILSYWSPGTDPLDDLAQAFRGYKPEGQRLRMVALMSALFKYAGIIEETTSTAKVAKVGKRASAKKPPSSSPNPTRRPRPRTPPNAGELPPSVAGLLSELPRGRVWTTSERDDWLATLEILLNRAYKVDDSPRSTFDDSRGAD